MNENPDTLSYFIKRELVARYKRQINDITASLVSDSITPSDLGSRLEDLIAVVKLKSPSGVEVDKVPDKVEGEGLPVKSAVRKQLPKTV